jgi:hypothetical protein
MMKCWKAMVRLVGGGEWHRSREHRKGSVIGIGKTNKGIAVSGVLAEQSKPAEILSGQVTISPCDKVRLHPCAWIWLRLAVSSVPSEDASWQQHLGFVAFTSWHRAHWPQPHNRALSQHVPQQQQAFAPEEMPRQNSLRFPLGQTH